MLTFFKSHGLGHISHSFFRFEVTGVGRSALLSRERYTYKIQTTSKGISNQSQSHGSQWKLGDNKMRFKMAIMMIENRNVVLRERRRTIKLSA